MEFPVYVCVLHFGKCTQLTNIQDVTCSLTSLISVWSSCKRVLEHQGRQVPYKKTLHLFSTPRYTSQCKPPCHFLPRHLWRKQWKHRHDHSATPSVGSKRPSRCHRTTASLQHIDSALPGGWTCCLSRGEANGNCWKNGSDEFNNMYTIDNIWMHWY